MPWNHREHCCSVVLNVLAGAKRIHTEDILHLAELLPKVYRWDTPSARQSKSANILETNTSLSGMTQTIDQLRSRLFFSRSMYINSFVSCVYLICWVGRKVSHKIESKLFQARTHPENVAGIATCRHNRDGSKDLPKCVHVWLLLQLPFSEMISFRQLQGNHQSVRRTVVLSMRFPEWRLPQKAKTKMGRKAQSIWLEHQNISPLFEQYVGSLEIENATCRVRLFVWNVCTFWRISHL